MTDKHLMLAVVTYSGDLEPATRACLREASQMAADLGWQTTGVRWAGSGLIADARNAVVALFLKSAATDLVFVDADVSWDGDALIRLCQHPNPFLAGVYRYKKEPESYPLVLLDDGTDPRDKATGLLKVALAPAGLLRLSRACLERMARYYADRRYYHANLRADAICLFDCGLRDGFYWGEDYTFCQRWRDIGGEVWVDPHLMLHHWGSCDPRNPLAAKRPYSGRLADWLATKPVVKIERQEAA